MRRSPLRLLLLLPCLGGGRAHAQAEAPPEPTAPPPATQPAPPTATFPPTTPVPKPKREAATVEGTVARSAAAPSSAVIKEGIQGGPQLDTDEEDTTDVDVSGGALLAGGNSTLGAVTGAFRFLFLRGSSQFSGGAAANYAQSKPGPNQPLDTTVENYQGALRYDYFVASPIAFFVAFVARRDRFQGLALRTRLDPGVALFMVRDREIRLWSELGYDLQNDVRTREAVANAEAEGFSLSRSELSHNGRLFMGYRHRIEDRLQFDGGVEYIRNFQDAERFRLNYSAALSTRLSRSFSIGVVATALYDNSPLRNVEKLDVTSSINLVYSLF